MKRVQLLLSSALLVIVSNSVTAGVLFNELKTGISITNKTVSIFKNALEFVDSKDSISGAVVYRNETIYVQANPISPLALDSQKLSDDYRLLAWEKARDKEHKAAVNFYQKSLELDANNASAWHGYGWSLSELGRFEQAQTAFLIALKLRKNADTWHRLGWNYEQKGDTEEAKRCYIEALNLDKNHKKASIGLTHLLTKN